jgi:hypothetical protein
MGSLKMGKSKKSTLRGMTPIEALQLLDQTIAAIELNRIKHFQLQEATRVLSEFIEINTNKIKNQKGENNGKIKEKGR